MALAAFAACAPKDGFDPARDPLPPPPAGDWRFGVLGDARARYATLGRLLTMAARTRPPLRFLAFLGDFISQPGSEWQWLRLRWTLLALPPGFDFFPVVGNHDVGDPWSEEIYLRTWGIENPYYERTIGGVRFLALSTEIPGENGDVRGDQLAWLRAELAPRPGGTPRTVVLMHRPVFSKGHYESEPMPHANELHALFRASGVKLVLASHDHLFYHLEKDGVTYVVSGGAGAPLQHGYPGDYHHLLRVGVDPRGFHLQSLGLDGRVHDALDLPSP